MWVTSNSPEAQKKQKQNLPTFPVNYRTGFLKCIYEEIIGRHQSKGREHSVRGVLNHFFGFAISFLVLLMYNNIPHNNPVST